MLRIFLDLLFFLKELINLRFQEECFTVNSQNSRAEFSHVAV